MSSLDTKESMMQITSAFLCKRIGRAVTNPIALAFLLTIIIMIIITVSFDDQHQFRTAFRIFSVSTILLFMNNHIIMQDMNCSMINKDKDNILRIVERGGDNMSNESMIVPSNIEKIINEDASH